MESASLLQGIPLTNESDPAQIAGNGPADRPDLINSPLQLTRPVRRQTQDERVGAGTSFLTKDHTVDHFRDYYYSPLIDRRRYELWVDKGGQTMSDRLKEESRRILASHKPVPLDPSIVKGMSDFITAQDRQAGRR